MAKDVTADPSPSVALPRPAGADTTASQPPDPQVVFAEVGRFVRWLNPKARECRIAYTTDSGESYLDVHLPPESTGADGLNDTHRQILAVLKRKPEPMKRASVAKACGRSDATGKFGISFRQLVTGEGLPGGKALVYKLGQLYTDDPTKFEQGT